MKPLPIRPLPVPSEPLSDFLERLAHANGYRAWELWSILDQGGFSHEKVLSDALNGYALPAFSGPVSPRVNIPVESYGLQSADFTHMHRRWCPLCIESAAWLRPIWRLKVATVCDIHRVHLLQACPACNQWTSAQSILHGTCECGGRFTPVVVPAARKLVQLARALAASLTGAAVFKLDGVTVTLTAPQLVRMICFTGRLIEGPQLSRPGQVRELEELNVASRIVDGVTTLLADWPNAFWRCLERYVDASPADASVRRVFGSLYHVIYKDLREPAFQFWRDAFELFLLDHWRGELCGRHRLFREETIHSHHNQGLARVARMTGVGKETLKRMVHQDWLPAHKFTVPSKRQFITIDRTQLSQFIPDPADYLDLRSAARLLGIKLMRVRQLVATGAILADIKPDWRRSNRWQFRRGEVCGFMDQIRRAALARLPKAATVTLNHALRYWRVSSIELCALLTTARQGEIPFMLAAEGKLRDVTFGQIGLHDWLERHRKSTTDWVTVTVAAGLLGLKEQVVYELVAKNLLVADLVQKDGRTFRRISQPSQERFRQEYVSLAELARQQKTSTGALLKRLEAQPVTGPKVDGGRQYFYKRGDLSGFDRII